MFLFPTFYVPAGSKTSKELMFLDEVFGLWLGKIYSIVLGKVIQWKPLIMNTLGPALFDNNNRLITLSGVATWGTIVYQYSTVGEFLPLMEMRCV